MAVKLDLLIAHLISSKYTNNQAMIKKIVRVDNVGKLQKLYAAGDVELKPVSLIFGSNGRGKSTLCDVLRSLQTGNTAILRGRKTLSVGQEPSAEIRLEAASASLGPQGWSQIFPDIEIFDSAFVHSNVYSGDYVTHDHKKRLHRVVLGEQGVQLAQRVDELDKQTRESESEIRQNRETIQGLIPAEVRFEDFIALELDPNIEVAIARIEREINAVAQANQIIEKPSLSPLTIPVAPPELEQLLATTTASISEEASTLVRKHLDYHTHHASEQWLAVGLGYIQDSTCPFCAQSLQQDTTSHLIKAFQEYFDRSYETLRGRIQSVRTDVMQIDRHLVDRMRHLHQLNLTLFESWKPFIAQTEPPDLDMEGIGSGFISYSENATRLLDAKLLSVAAPVPIDEAYSSGKAALNLVTQVVTAYNEQIASINALIALTKTHARRANLRELERSLARQKAIRTRHQPETIELVRTYQELAARKAQLNQLKNETKVELDRYSANTLRNLENNINRHLQMFGADFRISNVQESYSGGRPSATYQLIVDGHPVELSDQSADSSQPHFGNTLSSGDRSTLALAFFLSKLNSDPRLSDKVVVLDDPFNSQDKSRKMCTQQQIRRLSETSKQVIVLSHEAHFLKGIWDSTPIARRQCLQLVRIANYSTISEWNIEDHTRDEYFNHINRIRDFVHDGIGVLIDVARLIRPVLEDYLRHSYPGRFDPAQWLGDYISRIRDEYQNQNSPLSSLSSIIQELTDINEYARQFHHGQDDVEDIEIDPTELTAFARRTLQLVNAY